MNKELFIKKYLERIKYNYDVFIDITTLKRIQRQHLLTIPFENLDIISNKRLEFDINKLFVKIIGEKRGGICYELNGLLFHLLKEIGFNVKYISAKIFKNGNVFDHVFLIVNLNDKEWMVDVGFGDNFLEPIKFVVDEIQRDSKGYFKIIKDENGDFQLLKLSNESEHSMYTFTLKERSLEDCKERCLYFETSDMSIFRKGRMCSIEKENGRVSLTDDKLIITENGERIVKEITNKNEFQDNLKLLFN